MSNMSLKLPRLGHNQRKEKLEEYYGVHSNKEIALMCGVHSRTIDRDIAEWKDSGEYDAWLDREWHRYLIGDEVDARTKFIQLTRLKIKRMKIQIESTQQIDVNIQHDITNLLLEYEEKYESMGTQPIQKNNSTQ